MTKYIRVFILALTAIVSACSGGDENYENVTDADVDKGVDIKVADISDISADIGDDAIQEDVISNDVADKDVVTNDINIEDISQDVINDGEIPDAGDTTPPETTITSYPPNPSNSSTATFEFTCNEQNCAFECRIMQIDFLAWHTCTSPMTYRLADGSYTFEVRAKDIAGNLDPTPASYTWIISAHVDCDIEPGANMYCAVCGPCGEGQGVCHDSTQCESGLKCDLISSTCVKR